MPPSNQYLFEERKSREKAHKLWNETLFSFMPNLREQSSRQNINLADVKDIIQGVSKAWDGEGHKTGLEDKFEDYTEGLGWQTRGRTTWDSKGTTTPPAGQIRGTKDLGEIWRQTRAAANGPALGFITEMLDYAKAQLPVVTFSCLYQEGNKGRRDASLTGLMCFEIDHLEPTELASHRARLIKDVRVLLVFTSPSGNGLKIVVQSVLPKSLLGEESSKLFRETYSACAKAMNLPETANANTPERLCYLSRDEEVYFNSHAEPI